MDHATMIDTVKQRVEEACGVKVDKVVVDLDTTAYPSGDQYAAWMHVYYRQGATAYKGIGLMQRIEPEPDDAQKLDFLIETIIGTIRQREG